MRQGLFAILLILAAFAGGALINGPGIAWLRRQLADLNAPEGTDTAADGVPIPEVSGPLTSAGPSEDPVSSSPPPPLPVADQSPFGSPSRSSGELTGPGGTGENNAPQVRAPRGPSIASSSPPESPSNPDETSEASVPERKTPSPPASLFESARLRVPGRPITAASDRSLTTETPRDEQDDGTPEGIPEQRADASSPLAEWSDAPDTVAPARPVMPDPEESSPASSRDEGIRLASKSNPVDTEDWASVRRRMEELGVGRFWVEGEFGGPVVFRCVVPVVGNRAVSQHFESEADDLLTAAQDALRRIALWRATEPTP